MWKPTNQPATPGRPAEPERPTPTATTAPIVNEPPAAPRPVTTTTSDQATIGKSLVIKGEVTGSESLYIYGRVEGSINLSCNRVTVAVMVWWPRISMHAKSLFSAKYGAT